MADREGNVLYAPGYSAKTEVKHIEVLASTERLYQKGVTLKGGQGILEAGTILARETATKKYVKYVSGGTGGTGVAKGVLRLSVDLGASGAPDKLGNIILGGTVRRSALVPAVDAATLTALNGREDVERDVVIF